MSLQDINTYCDQCEKTTIFKLAGVWGTVLGIAEVYECEYCGNSIILEMDDVY